MSKKYRCPHCGKETVTLRKKFEAVYETGYIHRMERGTYHARYNGTSCSECGGRYALYPTKKIMNLYRIIGLFLIPYIILYFIGRVVPFPSILVTLLVLCFICNTLYLIVNFIYLFNSVPVVKLDLDLCERVIPERNAVVEVESSEKIAELLVYGLRIDKNTLSARFKERFKDGIVPAMFLQKRSPKGNRWLIYVIDTPEIPDEMLAPGTTFTLIHQGKELTRGRFEVKKD